MRKYKTILLLLALLLAVEKKTEKGRKTFCFKILFSIINTIWRLCVCNPHFVLVFGSIIMSSLHSGSQSPESSLQRSAALNISVGDTKSIVLALQSLQSKIRQLEKDRDYHHDQYERAIQSHEHFKTILESKMEEERSVHRIREKELSELLRKALEEKTHLTEFGSGSRAALAQLREELEVMIESERKSAKEREQKLLLEIEELRKLVKQEKSAHIATLLQLQELKNPEPLQTAVRQRNASRERAEQQHSSRRSTSHDNPPVSSSSGTARQVSCGSSSTVKTSSSKGQKRSEKHRRRIGTPQQPCSSKPHHRRGSDSSFRISPNDASRLSRNRKLSSRKHRHHCCGLEKEGSSSCRVGCNPTSPLFEMEYTNNYLDPTCNSMLRDVRNVSGLSPCLHVSYADYFPETTGHVQEALKTKMETSLEGNTTVNTREAGKSGRKTPTSRSPHRSVLATTSSARRYSSSARQENRRGGGFSGRESPSRQKVYPATEESLRIEINDLHCRLNEFLSSSSLSKMSMKSMRSHFQRLAIPLAHKEEQLSLLMRNSSLHKLSRSAMKPQRNESRQALMNEMRAIASNALGRQ